MATALRCSRSWSLIMSEPSKPAQPVMPGSGDLSGYKDQRDEPRRIFDARTMKMVEVPREYGSLEPDAV